MDHETLQALIKVYRTRPSADLLSIIMDEAEGPQALGTVLELLRSLSVDILANEILAPVRRKACQFCLKAEDFDLAERLSRGSDLPEDLALRARAFHGLGRDQDAIAVYREAVAQDPAMRNRELERLLGVRSGANSQSTAAKIIPLTNYSSRRENKAEQDRRENLADSLLDDLDEAAVTFADVAGLEDIKAEIRRRISLPYLKPSLFERYRQKPGGNILLYGPPGCGKTLIARSTAGETDARFLSVNPEEILDRYAGEAEKRLRVFFDEARSDTPAILFFDDFDLLAFRRTGATGEAAPSLISAFLSELDGTQRNNSGLLTIAATNRPWVLDRALFRAGRFHKVMFVPAPSFELRKRILGNALANVPGHDTLPLDRIARKTEGFSGADIRALADWVNNKTLAAALASSGELPITAAVFAEALTTFFPSAQDWMRRAHRELKALQREEPLARVFFPDFR
jgi:SpoVK/Ycf46/Vps4 family AAA+-type ATPase